ncbi:SDR family oxidoreductase [Adhaeribacter aerolatus]|uniref:SDR family oxidoreductase n=1 Tax=Adhaeribacter aerolatus TaxID=670289 RepID=A0A512AY84_9BACT|nr:SDR family oxidoreductase [Adhaeribacter aerolatus]GEO04663.1 SDR family oxidoreductase [Adhaeribacter aerolatus]
MNLENKLIVITGVSSGIGLATAQVLLEKGAFVVGWGRRPGPIKHPNFSFAEVDVRKQAAVERAYQETVERAGRPVSVLVNNAGLGKQGLFEEQSVEDWHLMFDTNVHGLFYCTRVVLPEMKKQEEGHIINIVSLAGLNGVEKASGYCATKFAVRGMSQSLYKEVREFGVKVSCIYPGSVNTNFFSDFQNSTAPENMMQPEDIASTILHVLQSPPNYHHIDIEVRPLRPKGKPQASK